MCRFINNLLPFALLACVNLAVADVIDGEELVDPTRPFFVNVTGDTDVDMAEIFRTVVPASYDVSFVRAGSSSPLAIINEQRVTIGDVIGGALVTAIDRNGVTLMINDEERRVTLYATNVKSPAAN